MKIRSDTSEASVLLPKRCTCLCLPNWCWQWGFRVYITGWLKAGNVFLGQLLTGISWWLSGEALLKKWDTTWWDLNVGLGAVCCWLRWCCHSRVTLQSSAWMWWGPAGARLGSVSLVALETVGLSLRFSDQNWFMSLVYLIAAARYWGLDVLVEKCRDRAKTGSCALSHRPPELPPHSSGAAAVLIMFTLKQILHEFCSKLNFILNNVNYLNKISSICHEHQQSSLHLNTEVSSF